MGKRSEKCGGNGELAARRSGLAATCGRRSRKRRRAAVAKRERRIPHRELRKRSGGLRPPIDELARGSLGGRRCKSSPDLGRISRCSSDASSEASTTPSRSSELGQRRDAASLFRSNGEREETTASGNHRGETSDVDSTVETDPCRRRWAAATPPEAELEEFFATAERNLRQRFAERYNFDVVNDVPMAGRFEWIPLTP
ncbi:cyclin-dependent kinase inhibitor 7-like [Zingiber officinale]|uniref:cyclin-dependent kinase inhibitor 7-like n=1 Tax=Zingiber officinale TaxID=94328 RepID=UPI001C4C022E|nr:cyclin-dependent kinase inhibitor 7-like [Zingiber officinale]